MLYLALLWHQHQPVYKDTAHPTQAGSYMHPWVRLHAIRDYYSMAALVAEHPNIHLTINLTPRSCGRSPTMWNAALPTRRWN